MKKLIDELEAIVDAKADTRKVKAGSFPKRCGCGKEEVIRSKKDLEKLPYVGRTEPDPLDPEYKGIEMRNCKCGSTLAVELE